MDIYL